MTDTPRGLSRRRLLQGGVGLATAGGAVLAVNGVMPHLWPERAAFGANTSHWARALPPPNPAPTRDLAADVLVIGGGYTGLSAAHYLRASRPDARIVLLEAVRCGNGASARNGAMLQTSTADTYLAPDVDPELHRRLYALTRENIERIRALGTDTGIDCELEQRGTLQVAYDHAAAADMPALAARLRAIGLPVEYWDAGRVGRALGTGAYAAGLYEPASGQVHPGRLVTLWKRAAERSGVEIHESAPVVRIDEGEPVRLELANGVVATAPVVVLATNAYTSKLGYLRNTVVPIVNHVAITAPLADAERARLGGQPLPFNDTRTNVVYAGVTRDGRLHIGGGVEDYEFNNGLDAPAHHARGVAFLRQELARVYPALAAVPFERTWWGFVDMSLDASPSIGRTGRHRNLYYAIGLSGQGVNFSSVAGRILADLVAGREAPWAWLPYLNRLPPYIANEPFRWLGVEGGIHLLSR